MFQSRMTRRRKGASDAEQALRLYLIPCSCGLSFSVAEDVGRGGSAWSRFLVCPQCGKRHDPRNRVLQLYYQRAGYWKVDGC